MVPQQISSNSMKLSLGKGFRALAIHAKSMNGTLSIGNLAAHRQPRQIPSHSGSAQSMYISMIYPKLKH